MPKGRKECPACKTLVPCRLKTCQCGHSFYGDSKPVTSKPPKKRGPKPRKSVPVIPFRSLPPIPSRGGNLSASSDAKCADHPRYTGSSAPKVGCPVCWGVHLAHKYGITLGEICTPNVIWLLRREDIRRLIKGLRRGLANTGKSGGLDIICVEDEKAGKTVQIRMDCTAELKKSLPPRHELRYCGHGHAARLPEGSPCPKCNEPMMLNNQRFFDDE